MKNRIGCRRIWAFGLLLVLMAAMMGMAQAEENSVKPVITQAYEQVAGKLYLEWEGRTPAYQVYVDGNMVKEVTVTSALIDLKKGAHTIRVVPISEKDKAEADGESIELALSAGGELFKKLGSPSFSFSIPTSLFSSGTAVASTPSEPLPVDYIPDPLCGAKLPEPIAAIRDDDVVTLTFSDQYGADEYFITVKGDADTGYIRYFPLIEDQAELITVNGSDVTVVLAPDYMREMGCMKLQPGKKYTFSVQLRRYAVSMVDGTQLKTVIHESAESKALSFMAREVWQLPPVMIDAAQTGEGQITLRWEHNTGMYDACDYEIIRRSKTLGMTTAETSLALVSEKEAIVNDLLDGDYCVAVIPVRQSLRGLPSEEATITVKNTWNHKPEVTVEQQSGAQVVLTWPKAPMVASYHVKVSVGDSKSLLSFVNLDYTLHSEFEVAADHDMVEAPFVYDGEIDPEKGAKLKFEIWGSRVTETGEEQRTEIAEMTRTLTAE